MAKGQNASKQNKDLWKPGPLWQHKRTSDRESRGVEGTAADGSEK